ncbi:MAG: hypothetical protein ABI947_00645 [Chloroflexota bacterium]
MSDRPIVETSESPETKTTPSMVRGIIIALAVLGIVIVLAWVIAVVGGMTGSQRDDNTFRTLRDFFIIVLALQGILVSVALVVLILQLTALINLLRNEIKPLIDEAHQTLTTVRGTTEFVSRNVTTPVIKVAAAFSGARAFLSEISMIRRNVGTNGSNKGHKGK